MPEKFILEKNSFFWSPDYLDHSAWIEHIPFAFWLVETIKPKVIVELGVHNGPSYFAFCQAVKSLNLNTTCYGIDTWKGDEHAGFYDEKIFEKVSGYNDTQFSRFSTLIRSTFDEAKDYFIDGSIELLHIDGLHTYDAVKHDFETWLPKLSPNAIVIFHDINVRERDFGVFKLWEELKQQYKNFQFDFGYGLGILAIGEAVQEELKNLFEENNSNNAYYTFLRNLFAERGSFFKVKFNLEQALAIERGNYCSHQHKYNQLEATHQAMQADKDDLLHRHNGVIKEHEQLKEHVKVLDIQFVQLQNLYKELEQSKAKHIDEYKILEANYTNLNDKYTSLLNEDAIKNEDLESLKSEFKVLEEKYASELLGLSDRFKHINTALAQATNELAQVKNDNELFRKYLSWYKATFLDRSMLGVIKEKSKQNFKDFYISQIDGLLKKESIKKKYAVSYSLEYLKEQGIQTTIKRVVGLIKEDGFNSFSPTALRQKAVSKLSGQSKIIKPQIPAIDFDKINVDMETFKFLPIISLVFPTYNTKPELLKLAIHSVQNQIYPNWELCIADDCSTNKETKKLLKAFKNDSKIKVIFLEKNVGISEASNAAINLATGDYLALMDHDDEITPDALYWVVKILNENIDADIIYSDECKIDEQGNRSDYFFKPQWSPELLFNMMYIGHLTVYRKAFLLNEVGLFRKEFDFSQDYDLALRATEKTTKIFHIDKVIYHWRITEGSSSQGDKPYARISNLAALKDATNRRNINGEVIELSTANRLKVEVNPGTKVSIIIPSDSYANLKETIESIEDNTYFENYEILAVTNSDLINNLSKAIVSDKVRYVAYNKSYNFSDKCNEGAQSATGNILLFFNDDVRPLQEDWLENTIEYLEVEGVGGVSPKLLYENDTIQYAGMVTGVRNLTGTAFHCYNENSTHYLNFPQLVRNVSILSGACMAMRKDLFLQVGGFDAINTPISHSDVDLSFKILEAGFRCVYTPYATLRHIGHLSLKTFEEFEVKEKKTAKDKADIFLLQRWSKYLQDPYFTVPMKQHLYHDSPEPYQVYASNKNFPQKSKRDVLLVSHDLSLSGAPLVLFNLSKILKSQDFFIVVVSPFGGPIQKMYQDIDVPVIIDELVFRQHSSFEKFAKNFELIICNTILAWPVVKQMQDKVKTIWWIHEGKLIDTYTENIEFLYTLKHAKHIVGVSDYSISFIKPHNGNIEKIYEFCDEMAIKPVIIPKNNDKIIFSLIASIEPRKGQDILIAAIEKLNADLLKDVEVWIIGRTLDQPFLNLLLNRIAKVPNIKLLGEKSHEECLTLMQHSHVVLNTSRDDPFPVVLVEALSLGKVCVVSTNTGVAEMIKNGVNGFIFRNENADDLAQKMKIILTHRERLGKIGELGKEMYGKHLSTETAKKKWLNFIEILSNENF